MKGKTYKSTITERWVDTYIEMNGHPPTYAEIGEHFEIKRTACYNRCSGFRHKMNHHEKLDVRTKIPTGVITDIKFKSWFGDNIGLDTTEKNNVFELCRDKIEKLIQRKIA